MNGSLPPQNVIAGKIKITGTKPTNQRSLLPQKKEQKFRSSSSSALKIAKSFKKSQGLSTSKFPNFPMIVEAMREADELSKENLALEVGSNCFVLRLVCIAKMLEIKAKFRLSDETFFLSARLLDKFIAISPQLIKALNSATPRKILTDSALTKKFPAVHEAKMLERVTLSSIFIAAKFQEIHPPKFSEIAQKNILLLDEFILIEATLLKAIDYNLRPPSFISYISIINTRVLGSSYFSLKIQRMLYIALGGNFLNCANPLTITLGLADLFMRKRNLGDREVFNSLRTELAICSKVLDKATLKFAQKFEEFLEVYLAYKFDQVVDASMKGENLFAKEALKERTHPV